MSGEPFCIQIHGWGWFDLISRRKPRDKTVDNQFEEENSYYVSAEVRGPQDGDLLPHGGGDVHQLQRAR